MMVNLLLPNANSQLLLLLLLIFQMFSDENFAQPLTSACHLLVSPIEFVSLICQSGDLIWNLLTVFLSISQTWDEYLSDPHESIWRLVLPRAISSLGYFMRQFCSTGKYDTLNYKNALWTSQFHNFTISILFLKLAFRVKLFKVVCLANIHDTELILEILVILIMVMLMKL